jgi:hypothetical protein
MVKINFCFKLIYANTWAIEGDGCTFCLLVGDGVDL